MMDIDYSDYTNFIQNIINTKDLTFFKSHPSYKSILEHVSESHGFEYLSCLKNTNFTLDDIVKFCELNDKQGNPDKSNFGFIHTSPTSLRYIWHAHLILTYFKTFSKDSYDILEIGGGYGGLCLAISFFSKYFNIKISSYTIVDLKNASELQKLYLENLPLSFPVNYVNAETYGKDIQANNLFLISNYCFSEISHEFQKKYIEHLFPKVSHGFLAWNMIPVYNFGFENITEKDEIPNTGGYLNKYVYF